MPLCANQRLDISMERREDSEWITLTLSDGSTVVSQCCEVGTNTAKRDYHRTEAIVIGLRRLVSAAIEQGLISVSWKTESEKAMSLTEWGFYGSDQVPRETRRGNR
jgi:hypothetical protein